jgi:RNA polymerase sigma-70 factor (ECF subfamily)
VPDSSDDALMQSVARNEGDAFRTLMQRHQSWVFSLLIAIVRNQQHAEDLTQEVFLRARQHAAKYRSQGEFASWLKRIAINAATDFLRKETKFIAVGLDDIEKALADERCSSPVSALLASTLREEVRTAIQSLPDDQRLVVVMRYFGDMSLQDIAWALKCPLGTVKSRLFYALRRIRQNFTPDQEQERGPTQ